MDSQINTTINLPTHPPTLLREIQDRIGGVLVRPSAALIWSGVLTAIMTGVPAFMAIYAAFADLLADPTKGIDLSGEQSITELSSLMSGAISNVFLSIAIFLLVALPFSYGAGLIGLRAIRNESPKRSDLFAPYLRAWDFSIFSIVLILSGFIPLLIWIVVAIIVSFVVSLISVMNEGDPTGQIVTIMLTVLIVGIPFIFLSIYFQFRLVYAGIAIIDPALDRMGAFPAIAKSWRMTRRQNGPLSVVALYAIWALIRGTIFGYLIGLFTRGLPEFVALFCGSYDVLADRLRSHEQSSHGSQ